MVLESRPADTRTLTLRAVPVDVVLAIKHCVLEYNASHQGGTITQTEVVSLVIRQWVSSGGQLPQPDEYDYTR